MLNSPLKNSLTRMVYWWPMDGKILASRGFRDLMDEEF